MSEYVELQEALSLDNRGELLSLYSDSSLDSLCQNLEILLEEHPNDPVIKLLWCDAQALSNNLPLPFVASSLLDLFEEETTQTLHPRLSFIVTQKITNLLVEAKEYRTAIFLATDFILKSKAQYFKNKLEFSDLKSSLLNIIDEEISLAVKKREPSSYRNSLEENKIKIKQAKPPTKIRDVILPQKPVIETKSDLASLNKIQSDEFVLGDLKPTVSHDIIENSKIEKRALLISEEIYPNRKKLFGYPMIIVLLIILTFLGYSKRNFIMEHLPFESRQSENDLNRSLILETKLDDIFKPENPEVKPFSLDNFRTSLDDINLRLAKLNNREKINLPEVSNNKQVADKSENEKETKVNEDLDEIVSLNTVPDLSATPPPTAPVPKLPQIPDNIGNSIDLNNGVIPPKSNSNPISNPGNSPSSIKTNPDGRVFGPPANSDPTQGIKNQRALDGSALQSYEVERYDQPEIYETITATNVLAAPSLLSQSITRLNSNTQIHVTARMGLWLELRSNEGKIGYIFAQDAEKK